MSVEENRKLIRLMYEEVYNRGNVDLVDKVYATDFYSHPNSVSPNGIKGGPAIKTFVIMLKQAIPDAVFVIEDEIAVDDKVVIRWSMTGTLEGPLFGFPPTGKKGHVTGITIHRFGNGKTIESWEEADIIGAFDQFLGILPPSEFTDRATEP